MHGHLKSIRKKTENEIITNSRQFHKSLEPWVFLRLLIWHKQAYSIESQRFIRLLKKWGSLVNVSNRRGMARR